MASSGLLVVKDGGGTSQNLQVNVGSSGGLVANHVMTSVVNDTDVGKYVVGTDFDWASTSKGAEFVAAQNLNRRSIIIHNSSSHAVCYVLLNADNGEATKGFGTIASAASAPQNYTFILEPMGTYFGDTNTCALAHAIYVPDTDQVEPATITVTEVS